MGFIDRLLKTCPTWPENGFENLEATREWVNVFSIWYNEKHCHSGIRFVTPSQRHRGEDKRILEHRNDVYKTARENNPSRWSGDTRNWSWIGSVDLNPDKTENVERKAA